MNQIVEFAVLGLGTGAVYALAAQGMVLIYRGSGIINFSHGAMALFSAALFVELRDDNGLPDIFAGLLAVLATAMIGLIVDAGIMRRIRAASPLARLVVTLGVLGVIESIVIIRYGSSLRFVEQFLPSGQIDLGGNVTVGADRIILCAIAITLTVLLWLIYQRSEFGRQTTAVAENPRSAAALGISAERISALNWMLGSGLAGFAGVLLIPLTGLMPVILVLMIIPTLAAALVGRFSSFPLTLCGGLGIGIAQSLIGMSGLGAGWTTSLPFLVIIALLVFQGRSLPLRGFINDRLPAVSIPRPPGWAMAGGILLCAVLILSLSEDYVNAITGSLIVGVILLSIVLLTGLAGQVSLGQYAFVGLGAFISARLADLYDLPFLAAFVVGVGLTTPLGLLLSLPALRTRGVNLAVVTLGLGVALDNLIFKNKDLTGGFEGTRIDPPSLLGWEIDSILYPERYALVALLLFVLCAAAVLNIRRGASGRRLLAVRSNERAAAALGISVTGAKLYAFTLAAAMASSAGVLSAFRFPNVRFDIGYTMFNSIPAVLMAFLGGIGFVLGAVIGGAIALGGIVNEVLAGLFDLQEWQGLLISGSAIVMVIVHPDGIAPILARLGTKRNNAHTRKDVSVIDDGHITPCDGKTLVVSDVTVRFGGLVALDRVGFTLHPGEVVGLIGPNGAGKTTLIDMITGFTRPQSGSLVLDGKSIDSRSAVERARGGIGRTFQSLELFDELTVADNVRVACDPAGWHSYLRDPIRPRNVPLPAAAHYAVHSFGLADSLDLLPSALSYGERRLLGIARAVAAQPSVLLLDEPAAGLGQEERANLAKLIRSLAEDWNMAVLLVEHDMNLVMEVCDRVVVLDFGRKIAEGAPREVANNADVVRAYLGSADMQEAAA